MTYEEVPIPSYRNEYDDLFDALIAAWRKGRAVRVTTDKHPQSVRVAMNNRLAARTDTRDLFLTVNVTDEGCVLFIEKERTDPPVQDGAGAGTAAAAPRTDAG